MTVAAVTDWRELIGAPAVRRRCPPSKALIFLKIREIPAPSDLAAAGAIRGKYDHSVLGGVVDAFGAGTEED